jgi:hypothetical protein
LNKAADSVREQENRALATQGDKTLSGSKCPWLYGAENLPSKHQGHFAAFTQHRPEDRSSVDDQGEYGPLLEVSAAGMRTAALRQVVLLGHALAHRVTPSVADGAIAAVAMIAAVTHHLRILAVRPFTYLPISCWLLDTRITTTRIVE